MIPLDIKNFQSFGDKASELSSPCKQKLPSIDFLEILGLDNSNGSNQSTNESNNSQTDEDTIKSVISFDIPIPQPSKRKSKKRKTLPHEQTIKEIISKRAYIKVAQSPDDTKSANKENINKKRKVNVDHEEEQENLVKKEKLADGGIKCFNYQSQMPILVPQVVIKDGKVQLITAEVSESQPLEIVAAGQKKVTTSSSFKKSTHTEKWAEEETKKFYRALELFGTDFSMIVKLFPNRNRNQIKNKFLKEEKSCPEKIDAIFKKTTTVNFSNLLNQIQTQATQSTQPLTQLDMNRLSLSPPSEKNLLIAGHSQESSAPTLVEPKEKSESLQKASGLDSIDMAIMQDLAGIFEPKKPVDIFSGILEESSVKVEADNI